MSTSKNPSSRAVEYHLRQTTTVFYSDHFEKNGAVQVCSWDNGEGFDFNANDGAPVSLTWQEWDALVKAVRASNKHDWKTERQGKGLTTVF